MPVYNIKFFKDNGDHANLKTFRANKHSMSWSLVTKGCHCGSQDSCNILVTEFARLQIGLGLVTNSIVVGLRIWQSLVTNQID